MLIKITNLNKFQSTLPCGSDHQILKLLLFPSIAIHAPLRERPCGQNGRPFALRFQSTLPCGSDILSLSFLLKNWRISIHAPLRERLIMVDGLTLPLKFQSTLPCGSDSIKTIYFSINLSQAFFAIRLNSNTQEFYFDVRKLLVSHSSLGCEPKLNYMFHITSHRIILHYFSSCQSICKQRFFNSLFPLYSKFSKNFSKYTVVA